MEAGKEAFFFPKEKGSRGEVPSCGLIPQGQDGGLIEGV